MSVPEDNSGPIQSQKVLAHKTSLSHNVSPNKSKGIKSSMKYMFKKKRVNLYFSNEEKLFNSLKADVESNLVTVKNPNSLYNYLINIPNFKQYIKLYNFDSKTIIDSFKLGNYVKLKKNFRLFNQGDKTDYFYLVIYGCIGFFLNFKSIKSSAPKEVNTIKDGTYFDEWEYMNNKNRTVSAYAKEDTLLLKFDKNCFKVFYQENILNTENKCKKFVINHIMTMKKLSSLAFN